MSFSVKVACRFIRVESPEGDTGERVEVGGPSRKEKDGPEHCSAGICGDADDLLPSSRMAQTQLILARAPYRCAVGARAETGALWGILVAGIQTS